MAGVDAVWRLPPPPSVRYPTRKPRQKRERGNLKARLRSKHVKTLLREYVYDHRFLVNSALYFHDKWSLRQGFPPLAVSYCDSVTIRPHWRKRTICPV